MRRPIWLDILEGGGVFIALPFLMFPTVKPMAAVLCMVGLSVIWVLSSAVGKIPLLKTPFNGVLVVFFFMTAVGAGVSAFPELTLSKGAGLIIGFAMWRFLTYAITDHIRLRWAVIGFLLLCAGMTITGIFATDWPTEVPLLRSLFVLLPERLIRLPESTSAEHANQLGGLILIYYPFVLSAAIASWNRVKRWYIIAGINFAAALITSLLVITQSRSTWIGVLVSIFSVLLTWAIFNPPSLKRTVLWVLLAGMILSGAVTVIIIGPGRLLELLREPTGMTALGKLDTLAFRQEVWRWAAMAISDFPFTGCGLGTFRQVVTLLYPMNEMSDIAHAHNIFLQVALDVGIPGLIAYVALLGLMSWEAWKAAHIESYRVLAVGILGGTLALHSFGILDTLALGSKPAIAFWYSLGLISALTRLCKHDDQASAGRDIEHIDE